MAKYVHHVWKYTRDHFYSEKTEEQLREFLEWAEKEKGVTEIYVYDTPPVYVSRA